ncbi:MAG: MBL fold metallo-hydrolase [Acetobacteraceae bacterium]|nr:MBL fold metallo-hydrolase [Acetobacteraceae bacterium]
MLNRRLLLGASAALPFLPSAGAEARAPFRNTTPPAWYRFKIGDFEATVVSDGRLPLGAIPPAFPASPPEEVSALMRDHFLPPDTATLEQNALVVNTGRHLILFDTGMGDSMGEQSKMFGPTTGKLLQNLRAAGIEPGQIDVVCATHAHCDHVWALVNRRGQRVFPNARVAISEADLRFWTDDNNKRGPDFMKVFIDGAKKNLSAYRDRMIMVRDGQEVVPGVTAFSAPGHTIGHHVYAIRSGNETLVNTGDLAHHQVLLLRKPAWEFSFDTDPKQSAQTRTRMLDRFATDREQILSYHFPWPGIGHVAREGDGYEWMPAPMNLTSVS